MTSCVTIGIQGDRNKFANMERNVVFIFVTKFKVIYDITSEIYAAADHTFSKRKSLRNRLFSQKIFRKKCGSFLGHFGSFLGHFGHFWVILGHSWAILGLVGPFWVIFGPLWVIFGHFWAISWHFWTNLRKVKIFCGPIGVVGLAFRMYGPRLWQDQVFHPRLL